MFGLNSINTSLKSTKKENEEEELSLLAAIIILIIVPLVMFLLAPWIWNAILRRLVPSLGEARWYDMFLLSILSGLLFN